MLQKIVLASLATLALGLLPAAVAHAGDPADGELRTFVDEGENSFNQELLDFKFDPDGEKVRVHDSDTNGYGALVELWWGGELQRWCYNTKGGGRNQNCNFEIPDGQQIRFYVAEISWAWFDCPRAQGCGKRRHHWAGPFDQSGCEANGYNEPCAFGRGDFVGRA